MSREFAGYDNWKLRSDLDDGPQGEPAVGGPTELELVYENLRTLREALLGCIAFRTEEDADYDEGGWRNTSTYHLTFNRPGFEDLLNALDLPERPGQSFEDVFNEARNPPNASAPIPLRSADEVEEPGHDTLTVGA